MNLERSKREIKQMKSELLDYYNEKYLNRYADLLEEFRDRSRDLPFEKMEELHREFQVRSQVLHNEGIREIKSLSSVSGGDIVQTYFKIFGRWHPKGF